MHRRDLHSRRFVSSGPGTHYAAADLFEEDRLHQRGAPRFMYGLGRMATRASRYFGCEIYSLDVLFCS